MSHRIPDLAKSANFRVGPRAVACMRCNVLMTRNVATTPWRLSAAGALAALLLGACSGSGETASEGAGGGSSSGAGSEASATQAPDPCALVPKAELDDAIGRDTEKTKGPLDQARGRTCTWSFESGIPSPGRLTISAWHGKEFYAPEQLGLMPLSGIGDQAAGQPSKGLIMVRKGDTVLQIFVISKPDRLTSAVTTIAKTAADNA